MKLLTSPPLYTHSNRWGNRAFASTDSVVWWFCALEFREYFDVPAEATKVWLEFHTLPTANRYRAQSLLESLYLDGQHVGAMPRIVNMIVRRIKTTECYVECHYV